MLREVLFFHQFHLEALRKNDEDYSDNDSILWSGGYSAPDSVLWALHVFSHFISLKL